MVWISVVLMGLGLLLPPLPTPLGFVVGHRHSVSDEEIHPPAFLLPGQPEI